MPIKVDQTITEDIKITIPRGTLKQTAKGVGVAYTSIHSLDEAPHACFIGVVLTLVPLDSESIKAFPSTGVNYDV